MTSSIVCSNTKCHLLTSNFTYIMLLFRTDTPKRLCATYCKQAFMAQICLPRVINCLHKYHGVQALPVKPGRLSTISTRVVESVLIIRNSCFTLYSFPPLSKKREKLIFLRKTRKQRLPESNDPPKARQRRQAHLYWL